MNALVKSAAAHVSRWCGAQWAARSFTRGAARILTYHGVDTPGDPVINADGLQVRPDVFRRQLETVARQFRVIPLAELVRAARGGTAWPRGAAVITFDDGYLNNLRVAAPILREMGLPATFFVATGYVSGAAYPWWYEWRAAVAGGEGPVSARAARALAAEGAWAALPAAERERRLGLPEGRPRARPYPFMRPEDVRALADLGFEIGAHTVHHVSCSGETPERVREEVEASCRTLAEWTGRPVRAFAYPYGHLPADLDAWLGILASAGLDAAVTTRMGFNRKDTPLHLLRRVDINDGRSPGNVSLLLSGLVGG